MIDDADDEFSEIYNAAIGRVDLVKNSANGMSFALVKAAALPAGKEITVLDERSDFTKASGAALLQAARSSNRRVKSAAEFQIATLITTGIQMASAVGQGSRQREAPRPSPPALLRKASKKVDDKQMAVFDQNGKLLGTVDPEEIRELITTGADTAAAAAAADPVTKTSLRGAETELLKRMSKSGPAGVRRAAATELHRRGKVV